MRLVEAFRMIDGNTIRTTTIGIGTGDHAEDIDERVEKCSIQRLDQSSAALGWQTGSRR